jgi:hypothetical protein
MIRSYGCGAKLFTDILASNPVVMSTLNLASTHSRFLNDSVIPREKRSLPDGSQVGNDMRGASNGESLATCLFGSVSLSTFPTAYAPLVSTGDTGWPSMIGKTRALLG